MQSTNTRPPFFGPARPEYPHLLQALRVTGGTVAGPSGYMSSSVLGPSLYLGFVQQLHPETLLPRDREPCLITDLNRYGLAPGYYTGRLAGNYQGLPVYEVGGSASSPAMSLSAASGLTPAQYQSLSTLTPAQFTVLNNLNPCQLQTLLTALPVSQISTLTLTLSPTQLSNFVNYLTTSQLTTLYSLLTTSQVITLTNTLNQQQFQNLTQTLNSTLTATQIQTLITSLTTTQLQTLSGLDPQTISHLVNNLTTSQLITFLNTGTSTGGLTGTVPINVNQITNTSYTVQNTDFSSLLTFNNATGVAVSLPSGSTFGEGYYFWVQNTGTGSVTFTPTGGTINGSSSLVIPAGSGATIVSDGTNYQLHSPVAGSTGSSGGRTEGTYTAAGSVIGDATAITTDTAVVSGADGTKGVKLPDTAGGLILVSNPGLFNLKVYPHNGSAQILGLGAGNAETLNGGLRRMYVRISSTQWYTVAVG